MSHFPSYEEVQKVRETLRDVSFEHWVQDDLWSFNWWLLVAATVLPFVIWWRLVDKERFFELLAFGLICGMIACFLDVMGVDLLLWGYPDKLFHFIPPLMPADFVVIPVSGMLIYQYFSTWKSFGIASAILSAIFAYIIELLFSLLHMFELIHWKHTYSFIGFILMFLTVRLLMLGIKSKLPRGKSSEQL
ncbi:hypothetical protein J7I93_18545 [Bacillus sp. ISL-47]|uniref:CBO0543 family protein n=1 Tax=Bacillus sp. ISL-47 TaxID=2819130 RepID=UPI001BECA133|nr:CBO0543 family protein [Bacillus sp. ISL-47]MBT2690172.1 hypothetical protein [Bacillus sp. ISL-47]MBT2710379.1 hypothetical protein [Pseudomonas sp. ISL-84]